MSPPPDKSTPIEQAETRTEQANLRTDQANTRTDEANARTEQANTRTAEANTRTEQADVRTEKAETQSEALRDSEINYRRLFESARDGILILDAATGHIADVNPFLMELLGYSHGEMVGKTVGELSPFKDILSNQAMLERLQKDGFIRYEDLPLETRDGRKIAVEFVSNVYQAGDKKVIQCNIRDITERKQAEGAMLASEARYRRLFEAAKDGILILNAATGRIVDVNPFLTELLGYARETFIGKHLWELGFFKDIAANEANFKELQAKDYIRYDNLALETSDDRRIEVEFVSNAYNVDGFRVMQCNIRDITERKQAEAAMIESRQMLRMVLDTIPSRVFWKDANSNYLGCNNPFARDAGLNLPDELVGKDDHAMGWADQAEAYRADDQLVIATGKPKINYEEPQTTSDGRIIWLRTSKVPLLDARGNIKGVLGTYDDITERKQMEESHARLATAIEQSTETIVITDTQARILYVNPVFEQTSGYSRAEALGQNPRILKSGKHDAGLYRQMWDVLTRGEVWHGHLINKRKDGTLYEEETTISPVRDAAGKVVNYVAVKRDVTHEMQIENQFRQLQKMEAIGTLAGGVAHDFNNILAIIQMQASLLKSSGDLSPGQMKFADEIGTTIDRAAALTRQLLLFSRKETLQAHDLDLSQSIDNMTKMLRRTLGENIEVQLKLAAQPMFIHADAGMMDQVLLNLAVNAHDAMPQGGRLIITTAGVEFDEFAAAQSAPARPGAFVCLSVADTGGGIPPEILPRIFEPFFTTKAVGKGTGLGLATVFGIVQQHKGWINVYSEVGHGTTFRIYLPRLTGMTDIKVAQKMLATVPTGDETILLVEDEPALRTSMNLTLTNLGYRVLEAATGNQALEVWQEHGAEIRLLLTDLMMPDGMTGKELAQRLVKENQKLKVVYMSGYSADLIGKDFPVQENVNFLAKPFHMQKLAQILRDSLDKHASSE
ncbi:MAG TPA: PAS domain S-box protein [Verrucomicrobiae bacterium]